MGKIVKEVLAEELNVGVSDLDVFNIELERFSEVSEFKTEFIEYYMNKNINECERSPKELLDLTLRQSKVLYTVLSDETLDFKFINLSHVIINSIFACSIYLLLGTNALFDFIQISVFSYLSLSMVSFLKKLLSLNSLRRILKKDALPIERGYLEMLMPILIALGVVVISVLLNELISIGNISPICVACIIAFSEIFNLIIRDM